MATAATMAVSVVGIQEVARRFTGALQLDGRDTPAADLALPERRNPRGATAPATPRSATVQAAPGAATDLLGALGAGSRGQEAGRDATSSTRADSPTTPGNGTVAQDAQVPVDDSAPLRGARLSIRLEADRATVEPGGLITYTMVVVNDGDEGYDGQWLAEAHYPAGTHLYSDPCGYYVGPSCWEVSQAYQGSGREEVHLYSYSHGGEHEVGQEWPYSNTFRVNSWVEPGTVITNHAHLTIQNGGDEVVHTPTIEVLVVAPGQA